MNYLSHYYIDNKPGNYYFNSALFLPDFARNYVQQFTPAFDTFLPEEQQLFNGCQAHYAADKVFHPSVFFKQWNETIKQEITSFEPLNYLQRKWFLSHILTEMLIDRQIVKIMPTICKQFYGQLDEIDTKILHLYVSKYAHKNVDPLVKHFQHFCEVKYMFGYAQDESFIFSLSRVYGRATGIELNLKEKQLFKELVNFIEQNHFKEPIAILAELKNMFTPPPIN